MIAGIAAGRNSGIAKGANIIPVKMTDRDGSVAVSVYAKSLFKISGEVGISKRPSVVIACGDLWRQGEELDMLTDVRTFFLFPSHCRWLPLDLPGSKRRNTRRDQRRQ
jgi:hypothetical protein